jgi:hypothetical protein
VQIRICPVGQVVGTIYADDIRFVQATSIARYVLVRRDTLGIRECGCEGSGSSTSDGERVRVKGGSCDTRHFVASDDDDGEHGGHSMNGRVMLL